ncbi:MAG TPA: hypothetical protein VNH65_02055 [Candidatus Acidoferrum sp.]|nr:hypothetical protein [Candidatus Acidoferrum sp.]
MPLQGEIVGRRAGAAATAPAVALGRCGFLAQGLGRGLRFDGFAQTFGVEFAAFEKVEDLVCGQSIFAHGKNYLAVGGLHRETDSYPLLPQDVDGLHDVVC